MDAGRSVHFSRHFDLVWMASLSLAMTDIEGLN